MRFQIQTYMKTKKVTSAIRKKTELEMLRLHARHLWLMLGLHEARSAHLRKKIIANGRQQKMLSTYLSCRRTRKQKE